MPAFQFGPLGQLLPDLADVLPLLDAFSDDSWDKGLWLLAPSADFSGRTAADLLREGLIERVLVAAHRDARASRA